MDKRVDDRSSKARRPDGGGGAAEAYLLTACSSGQHTLPRQPCAGPAVMRGVCSGLITSSYSEGPKGA